MGETAMSQAMRQAGVTSAEDRLHDIAVKAMVAHADDTEETISAIWSVVQKDRILLIELFKFESSRAIQSLLFRVRARIASASKQDIKKTKGQQAAERLVDLHEARQAARETEINRQWQAKQDEADRQHHEHLAMWKRTEIGDIEVHGTPIWKVTAGTAKAWLVQQRRPLRCVELLIQGVPEDGNPIEFYRRPSDVADLWKQAMGN